MQSPIMERALRLGATLYMPAINSRVLAVLRGEMPFGAGSVVICLEDALAEADIERGLDIVRQGLAQPRESGARAGLIFLRPRNLEMARRIAAMPGIETIDGMVAPKFTLAEGYDWLELARMHDIALMPTLETAEYFDPSYVIRMREMFDAAGPEQILAIRIGGNDLLNTLGVRRVAGRTSHEGPLSWVLSMISSQFMSHGYPVTAPVYDIIGDLETLRREVKMDVEFGLVGKTAIHPSQIPVIHEALRVNPPELAAAQAIVADGAEAVFKVDGIMCEPATHRAWARRIIARSEYWGVRNSVLNNGFQGAVTIHEELPHRVAPMQQLVAVQS
jgi:citrate lyase beta subunit